MDRSKGGQGLRGPDHQQGSLRDDRSGTYDSGGQSHSPLKREARRTEHQRAQFGADVRQGVPDVKLHSATDSDLPEGLQRPRKGPYDKRAGRNAQHSPLPNSTTHPDE